MDVNKPTDEREHADSGFAADRTDSGVNVISRLRVLWRDAISLLTSQPSRLMLWERKMRAAYMKSFVIRDVWSDGFLLPRFI